ncbi:MAG TPA: archaeal proteasome endopeptidase complex subunit alpha [Candidatus Woesearchaeota archaeon]|nr:archaeal proteasome endopeptidase complex subunit alpha [Candidatus Woesearchaeota archaeon]
MEALPNEIMGYDRAITVFSPDGRLLQVEYARKTVSQGSTAIGLVCKDGIILVADKRILEKFVVARTIEKIYQVDEHVGATMSGLISDGRVLIEKSRVKAQNHKILYEEASDVLSLVKDVADQQQVFTQYAGARPYGVSLLVGGVDESGARLFMTEPSGIYFEYKAISMGEGAAAVNKVLEKNYKENMTTDQGLKLALSALKTVLGTNFSKERLDVAIISTLDKKYKKLEKADIDKALKE